MFLLPQNVRIELVELIQKNHDTEFGRIGDRYRQRFEANYSCGELKMFLELLALTDRRIKLREGILVVLFLLFLTDSEDEYLKLILQEKGSIYSIFMIKCYSVDKRHFQEICSTTPKIFVEILGEKTTSTLPEVIRDFRNPSLLTIPSMESLVHQFVKFLNSPGGKMISPKEVFSQSQVQEKRSYIPFHIFRREPPECSIDMNVEIKWPSSSKGVSSKFKFKDVKHKLVKPKKLPWNPKNIKDEDLKECLSRTLSQSLQRNIVMQFKKNASYYYRVLGEILTITEFPKLVEKNAIIAIYILRKTRENSIRYSRDPAAQLIHNEYMLVFLSSGISLGAAEILGELGRNGEISREDISTFFINCISQMTEVNGKLKNPNNFQVIRKVKMLTTSIMSNLRSGLVGYENFGIYVYEFCLSNIHVPQCVSLMKAVNLKRNRK